MAGKAADIEGLDAYLTQMTMAVRLLDGQGFGADARALAAELLRRLERVDLHGDKDASLHAHDLTEVFLLLGQRERARDLCLRPVVEMEQELAQTRNKRRTETIIRVLPHARSEAIRRGFGEHLTALSPRERAEMAFVGLRERASAAVAREDVEALTLAAREAEPLVKSGEPWQQRWWHIALVDAYARAGDTKSTLRVIKAMDVKDRDVRFVGKPLLALGRREMVFEMARHQIQAALGEARNMDLPNYHHTAMEIEGVLKFFADLGEVEAARKELRGVMAEVNSWPMANAKVIASAVFSHLAPITARLEGSAAAARLLEQASNEADGVRSATWRGGAQHDVAQSYDELGDTEKAIELTRKNTRGKRRRQELGPLLAKAGRWDELHELLRGVETPEEACEVALWVFHGLNGTGD
jgi:hypothetical protein